jgi:hypothetical protein
VRQPDDPSHRIVKEHRDTIGKAEEQEQSHDIRDQRISLLDDGPPVVIADDVDRLAMHLMRRDHIRAVNLESVCDQLTVGIHAL